MQQVRKLLTSRKAREAAGLFVSDGTKLLKEAAAHCPGLETAFLCDGVEVELPENVRVVRVSKEVMEAISPMETPQGAVFLCRLPEKKSFVPEKGMLLLDGIQDPGNVGTILRTARQVGFHGTPILGINYGRLGFLANPNESGVMEPLVAALSGDATHEVRTSAAGDGPGYPTGRCGHHGRGHRQRGAGGPSGDPGGGRGCTDHSHESSL